MTMNFFLYRKILLGTLKIFPVISMILYAFKNFLTLEKIRFNNLKLFTSDKLWTPLLMTSRKFKF